MPEILPIVAYGDPVLRKPGEAVTPETPGLPALIANMFATMDAANGVGLAAPQVGLPLLLFVVDTTPMAEGDKEDPQLDGFRQAFLNAEILEESGEEWPYQEGCLSIPGIREDVKRQATITLKWQDPDFTWHEETFFGLRARVIQHEYDHTQGKLFTDYLTPLKKALLKSKLQRISKGQTDADYPMRFYSKKRLQHVK